MVRLGLIGYPLGHSFSAEYFSERFRREGIEGEYKLFPLESKESIGKFMAGHRHLTGFNVTIPYKQDVMRFLDSVDKDAKAIGAVNTVKLIRREDGTVEAKGFNTDWRGFAESLAPVLRPDIDKALVLGTGGAARGVAYALGRMGIEPLFVSRNPDTSGLQPVLSYQDLSPEIMDSCLLVVNTTPAGMSPDVTQAPALPYHLLSPRHVCYDLVYNPADTMFMKKAKQMHATVKNGMEMLHLQAEHAWRIWQSQE